MPDSEYVTVEIPAIALSQLDLILRDPDHPDVAVHWLGTHTHTIDGNRIFDYSTPDGTTGRHVFEDQTQMVTVAVRKRAPLPCGSGSALLIEDIQSVHADTPSETKAA